MQSTQQAKTVIRCILPHADFDIYFAWHKISQGFSIQEARAGLDALGKGKAFDEYVAIADKAEDFIRRAIGLNLPIPIGTTIQIPNQVELVISHFNYEFMDDKLILLCQINYLK